MIRYSKQYIDDDDINAVVDTLKSDWLTTGPKVKEFEEAFAEKCSARYAVSCSSGTAGLHLACLAGGISEKHTLVTSPITFVASANCGKFVGANVRFADVDPESICMDPDALNGISQDQKDLCILPVHFAGVPANMESIFEWSRKKSIIIEDACHALGAAYISNGQEVKVGSCKHSNMAVFSFHPVKHMTTGEGGMITTNDKTLYGKLLLFRNHGIIRNHKQFVNENLAFNAKSKDQNSNSVNPLVL